jgi:hypothetical protein
VIFMNVRNIRYESRKYEDIDDAADFILKVSVVGNMIVIYRKWG